MFLTGNLNGCADRRSMPACDGAASQLQIDGNWPVARDEPEQNTCVLECRDIGIGFVVQRHRKTSPIIRSTSRNSLDISLFLSV